MPSPAGAKIDAVPNSPKEGTRIRCFRFDDATWDELAAEALETGEKDVSKVVRRIVKAHIEQRSASGPE